MSELPSSPPHEATADESLAWYKKQYEQLADELADFRESSHELEAELEKDLDLADKRQRDMEQKAETLQFEAEEWKVGLLVFFRWDEQRRVRNAGR
ncbi:hypothetical protein GGR57DRAFT_263433 [Xylariaceae sp. FL1272]|nr:hypothetical protein GGR57DRAFT_263433 [Xylariaceae sp. FL1272]